MVVIFMMGLVAAVISAATGIGWGTIIVPILIALLKVKTPEAVAATMISAIVLCIVSGAVYYRFGHINLRLIILLSIAGSVGAIIGSYLGSTVPTQYMEKAVGLIIIILGAKMLLI